ncbi:MAG: adenylate/guanylate cyclase domain-containing protein, partial [Gammaproteobacteria bacterium]
SAICDAVVMFADLRGYTSLSEALPPRRVVTLLNEFFALLVDTAHRHEGTTISMAGDCLMIAFGVPFAQPDAADRAVATALACRQAFAHGAARWSREHGVEVGLGIGINGGEVIAGNVGAPAYMSYTLIGDVVNVAARLTARARDGEILMTEAIGCRLDIAVPALSTLHDVQLKGRSAAIDVLCATAPQRPHAIGANARGGLTKFVG